MTDFFKRFVLVLALLFTALPTYAAWGCESVEGVTLTNDIYWKSLPTALRVLEKSSTTDRDVKSVEFARAGYKIDVPIMVWGWDPVCTMLVRVNTGYTWVPSALEPPVVVAPGISFPGLPKYDPDRPSQFAIKVSIKKEDFPEVDAPPPPPQPAGAPPKVGVCFGQPMICGVGIGGMNVQDNEVVTQDGKKFIAHVSRVLTGITIYFTPIP